MREEEEEEESSLQREVGETAKEEIVTVVREENMREDPWFDLKRREWRKKSWVGVEG